MKALEKVLLITLLLFTGSMYGQDCRTMLLDIIRAKNGLDKPYVLEFSVKTTQTDSKSKKLSVYEDKVSITMTKERRILKSSKVEIFEDTRDKFVVIPDSRRLYRFDSNTSLIKQKKKNNGYELFMDSMVYNMNLERCEDQGSGIKVITLSPNKKAKRVVGVVSVCYKIDVKEKKILWSKVDYDGSVSGIISMEYYITKWMEPGEKEMIPARDYFFGSGLKLLPSYRGYSYEDKRIKK